MGNLIWQFCSHFDIYFSKLEAFYIFRSTEWWKRLHNNFILLLLWMKRIFVVSIFVLSLSSVSARTLFHNFYDYPLSLMCLHISCIFDNLTIISSHLPSYFHIISSRMWKCKFVICMNGSHHRESLLPSHLWAYINPNVFLCQRKKMDTKKATIKEKWNNFYEKRKILKQKKNEEKNKTKSSFSLVIRVSSFPFTEENKGGLRDWDGKKFNF